MLIPREYLLTNANGATSHFSGNNEKKTENGEFRDIERNMTCSSFSSPSYPSFSLATVKSKD
jgi:hypothetical protein